MRKAQITEDDVPINWENLAEQQKHLAWLRRQSVRRITKFHKFTFPKDHKYYQPMPSWVPRQIIERRLFFWFCARNYHLQDPFLRDFRKKAHAVLSEPVVDEVEQHWEEMLWGDLRVPRRWVKDRSVEMGDRQVGRILCLVGYDLDEPPDICRRVLAALAEERDVVLTYAKMMQKMIGHRLNEHCLQKLVLENPAMGWPAFKRCFGLEMPTVTQSSFYFTRSNLRSQGNKIPSPIDHSREAKFSRTDRIIAVGSSLRP